VAPEALAGFFVADEGPLTQTQGKVRYRELCDRIEVLRLFAGLEKCRVTTARKRHGEKKPPDVGSDRVYGDSALLKALAR
jgi:hypothetical protein